MPAAAARTPFSTQMEAVRSPRFEASTAGAWASSMWSSALTTGRGTSYGSVHRAVLPRRALRRPSGGPPSGAARVISRRAKRVMAVGNRGSYGRRDISRGRSDEAVTARSVGPARQSQGDARGVRRARRVHPDEGRRLALVVRLHRLVAIVCGGDRLAVELADDLVPHDARARGGRIRGDTCNQGTRGAPRRHRDAEPCGQADVDVGATPRANFGDDLHRLVARNCEPGGRGGRLSGGRTRL